MKFITKAVVLASLVVPIGALLLSGCDTWHGLGKDIGKTGDAMAGEGKYEMTVQATPDRVTLAARKAVEQLKFTDIESAGDRSEGKVTAKTDRRDSVRIDIEQIGTRDSKVTVYTHGDNADTIGKKVQDQIRQNL
jgi:predicted small secreted protein